jgi:hypothetical protein
MAAGIEPQHAGSCAFAVLHADPRHPCSYTHRVHTACAPVPVHPQAPPCFSLRVKVRVNMVCGYAAQRCLCDCPVCVCSHAGRPQPPDLLFPNSRPFSLPFCRTLDIFPFPLLSPFSPSLGDGCLNTRTPAGRPQPRQVQPHRLEAHRATKAGPRLRRPGPAGERAEAGASYWTIHISGRTAMARICLRTTLKELNQTPALCTIRLASVLSLEVSHSPDAPFFIFC